MSTVGVAVCCLLLFALIEVAFGTYLNHQRKAWRLSNHRTAIRYQFADARHSLVKLTVTKDLDPRSETFASLYTLQTLILRRPDQHEQIQEILYNTWLRHTRSGSRIDSEAVMWSDNVKAAIKKTALALGAMVSDASPWYCRNKYVCAMCARNPSSPLARIISQLCETKQNESFRTATMQAEQRMLQVAR